LTAKAPASAPLSPWRPALAGSQATLLVFLLVVLFAAMRFLGMLGPASLRPLLPISFVMMTVAPWLLLGRNGRLGIGLQRPRSWLALGPTILAGVLAALACFALGLLMFGHSQDNWYMTIAANYRGMMDTAGFASWKLHLVFTLPALLLSPIGEEIFFRGLLQGALEQRLSVRLSTLIECGLFGLVHLCHHGIAIGAAGLTIRPISAAIWVGAMFLTAFLFAAIRKRTGSLFPAIAAHAAFNATMNAVIFAFLWH
jgi:hypothetical protein